MEESPTRKGLSEFQACLDRGDIIDEEVWKDYRNSIKRVGLINRLVGQQLPIDLISGNNYINTLPEIKELVDEALSRKFTKFVENAIEVKDWDFLKELDQSELKTLDKELMDKVRQCLLIVNTKRHLREKILLQEHQEESVTEQEIELVRNYLSSLETKQLSKAVARRNFLDFTTSLNNLINLDIESDNETSVRSDVILKTWTDGLFIGKWKDFLSVYYRTKRRTDWTKAFRSDSDQRVISEWEDPYGPQINTSDAAKFNLGMRIKRLGALTRLKWIKFFQRGNDTKSTLALMLTQTDLIFEKGSERE